MTPDPRLAVDRAAITGVGLVSCYVDDFQAALPFYVETLGLRQWSAMGPHAGTFELPAGPSLFVIGRKHRVGLDSTSVRCSFAFRVGSVEALVAKLRQAGVACEEPMDMGDGSWWISFRDPSGNLLEAIGGQ